MNKITSIGVGVVFAACSAQGNLICASESEAIHVTSPVLSTVDRVLTIYTSPWWEVGDSVTVGVDGMCLFSTTNQSETAYRWQPQTLGNHTLTCTFGTNVLTNPPPAFAALESAPVTQTQVVDVAGIDDAVCALF